MQDTSAVEDEATELFVHGHVLRYLRTWTSRLSKNYYFSNASMPRSRTAVGPSRIGCHVRLASEVYAGCWREPKKLLGLSIKHLGSYVS